MKKGIRLSEKHGVNATLTYCPRCGREGREILLVGKAIDYECESCHGHVIGIRPSSCPHCEKSVGFISHGEFDGLEQRLSGELCESCEKEVTEFDEILKEGGIFWKCSDCKKEGMLRKCELTESVRKEMGIEAPNPCGIEFSKKDCPACSK